MLKPDPERSRAVVTRISGPDWTEPDPAETNMAALSDALAFHHEDELPADLALDLRLHELLEHSLRSSPATGAVIALASGDKMVCRATSGEKAPKTGVFVNTRSGLSGLCVQTRQMQNCEDTLNDPRMNADACHVLDIRSIVVLPILAGKKFWGILEVFSSRAKAFDEADVKALQVLERQISETIEEAVDGGTLPATNDSWVEPSPTDGLKPYPATEEPGTTKAAAAELRLREAFASQNAASGSGPAARQRDYRTTALTVTVIALAALLGWMVGRAGWSMAVNRADAQLRIAPEEAQASVQVTPQMAEPPSASDVQTAKAVGSVEPAPPRSTPKPRTQAQSAAPAGGLVVYEQGRVVFRTSPSPKPKPSGDDSSSIRTAQTLDNGGTEQPATAPPPSASYVLERVEPKYPEEAKEKRVQGAVVLSALVGTNGVVRELKLMSGDPLLVKAATEAVNQWRFQPHRVHNRPVEFETQITVNFALP